MIGLVKFKIMPNVTKGVLITARNQRVDGRIELDPADLTNSKISFAVDPLDPTQLAITIAIGIKNSVFVENYDHQTIGKNQVLFEVNGQGLIALISGSVNLGFIKDALVPQDDDELGMVNIDLGGRSGGGKVGGPGFN
jgi:hypothetical protein